jgi:hypothetical protein
MISLSEKPSYVCEPSDERAGGCNPLHEGMRATDEIAAAGFNSGK